MFSVLSPIIAEFYLTNLGNMIFLISSIIGLIYYEKLSGAFSSRPTKGGILPRSAHIQGLITFLLLYDGPGALPVSGPFFLRNEKMSMKEKIIFFDTTLRDGEQSSGFHMNDYEKTKIAENLAKMNVDIIEAGFPISSPGDFQSVNSIAK